MCVLDLPKFYLITQADNQEMIQEVKEVLEKELKSEQVPQLYLVDDSNACYEQGLVRRIVKEREKTIE